MCWRWPAPRCSCPSKQLAGETRSRRRTDHPYCVQEEQLYDGHSAATSPRQGLVGGQSRRVESGVRSGSRTARLAHSARVHSHSLPTLYYTRQTNLFYTRYIRQKQPVLSYRARLPPLRYCDQSFNQSIMQKASLSVGSLVTFSKTTILLSWKLVGLQLFCIRAKFNFGEVEVRVQG